jgi:hypothetical protein
LLPEKRSREEPQELGLPASVRNGFNSTDPARLLNSQILVRFHVAINFEAIVCL